MNRKFGSMWRIAIALVLALSLSLVTAAPAAAAGPWYVDDSAGSGGNGTTAELTGANCAFQTIGAAITAASSGDTINVAAGTYPENITIPEGKNNLQLLGAGMANTIISPPSGTAITPNSPVTIKGFHILQTDAGTAINVVKSGGVSGTALQPAIIQGNKIESPSLSRGDGIKWSDYLCEYWEIKDNEFINRKLTIYLNRASHLVISGNTLSGYKEGIGMNWDGEPAHDLTITGNKFLGTDFPFNSQELLEKAAIMVGEVSYNVNISGNTIIGSPSGIRIVDRYPLEPGRVPTNLDNVHINGNNISNNTNYGVKNDVSVVVDATLNWWGNPNGPSVAAISGVVDYSPWLPGTWQTYFNPDGTAKDTDEDGFSDLQEYWLGTYPTDATSKPGAAVGEVANAYAADGGTAGTGTTGASIIATAAAGASAVVNLAEYGNTPTGESVFSAVGQYIDVHTETPENLTEVEIRVYYDEGSLDVPESSLRMYYWNSEVSDWRQCSDQGVNVVDNYIWAKIRSNTTPTLSYLTGGPLGGGSVSVELEFDWYQTGETVNVTVEDTDANNDPIRTETVQVTATSDTDIVGITVTLRETGANTGIFRGSFPLVPTVPEPGADQLAVEDGDEVEVKYLDVVATATVDDTLPVVTIVIPDFINSANEDAATVTITSDEDGTYTYTISDGTNEVTASGAITAGFPVVLSLDLSSLDDGEIFANASVEDAAGNTGNAVADTATKEATAPVVTIVIAEAINSANVGAVPVTITSDEDGTYTYIISDGVTDVTASGAIEADVPVALSLNLSGLVDGPITANASVEDAAGNTGDAVEDTATKDIVAPVVTIVIADPINSANVETVAVTITSDENGTYTYTISDGVNPDVTDTGDIVAGVPVELELDLSGLSDGEITANASVEDAAGNTSDAVADTATKEATAPVVTITIPDYINPDNEAAVPLTITSDENGTYTYTISDGVNPDVTDTGDIVAGVPVELSLDLSELDDGTITANASVEDAAGNTGDAPEATATKDIVEPVVTIVIADPINSANVETVAVTITSDEDGTYTYTISDGTTDVTGTDVITAGTPVEMSLDLSGLSDGEITANASVEDAAGNTGEALQATATKEATAPVVTIVIAEAINSANVGAVPVTITSGEDGTYTYIISDGVTDVTASGAIEADVPVALSLNLSSLVDGPITANASVEDAAGNTGNALEATATKDVVEPVVTITIDDPINSANVGAVPVTITSDEDGTYTYIISDGVTDVTASGAIEADVPVALSLNLSGLVDGPITANASVEDAAGNTGDAVEDTATKEATAPVVTITIDDPINSANVAAVAVTITSDEDGTYTYIISDGVTDVTASGAIEADVPVALSLNLSGLVDGPITANASVLDAAGNTGNALEANRHQKDTEVPVVTLISPNGGEVWQGGSEQTITWGASDVITNLEDLSFTLLLSRGRGYDVEIGTSLTVVGEDITLEEGVFSYTWTVPNYNNDHCRIKVVAVDLQNNSAFDVSDGYFTITTPATLEIELAAGWNLISLPVIPGYEDITVVISPDSLGSADLSNVVIVRYYDPTKPEGEKWLWYSPDVAESTLLTMEDGKGYWIYMGDVDTLTVSGSAMPAPGELPHTYAVVPGWNLIGFKSVGDMDHMLYLTNIVSGYSVLWGYDAVEGYFNVYPMNEHGGVDDVDIGDMEVGYGYWLWATQSGTIVPVPPVY